MDCRIKSGNDGIIGHALRNFDDISSNSQKRKSFRNQPKSGNGPEPVIRRTGSTFHPQRSTAFVSSGNASLGSFPRLLSAPFLPQDQPIAKFRNNHVI
jgi:hypothetical protein